MRPLPQQVALIGLLVGLHLLLRRANFLRFRLSSETFGSLGFLFLLLALRGDGGGDLELSCTPPPLLQMLYCLSDPPPPVCVGGAKGRCNKLEVVGIMQMGVSRRRVLGCQLQLGFRGGAVFGEDEG